MQAWRDCKLGDAITLKRGYDLPKQDRMQGRYPIVSSSGITDYHAEAKVKGPGVVTGRYGTLGEVFYVQDDFWPLNTSLYVQDFKGNDPKFISYFLRQLNFGSRNAAGAVPGVNRNHLHAMNVRIPSLDVQQRIAGILSAYDELIENNQRRIRVLEEMARALYREWFVEFRFPGHERTSGIDSSLGPIPEGWQVQPLENICLSVQDGDWIETKDQGGEDYRLVQISNVGVGEFIETGNYRYITAETFRRLKCTEIQSGDILVARMPTPIGRAWLAQKMPWRMITAVDVAIVRANPRIATPIVLACAWNDPFNLERIAGQASGTTRPRVTRRELAALQFIVPPLDLQHRFSTLIEPHNALAQTLRAECQVLGKTRDLLLPRLMEGGLDR